MQLDSCGSSAGTNVYVLGVDWDTHRIAFTLLDPKGVVCLYDVHEAPGKLASDRFPLLMAYWSNELATNFFASDALIIVIEDAPFIKNRAAYGGLAQVLGGLRALAFTAEENGLPIATMVHLARGSAWKKALDMSGNASKNVISDWVTNNCDVTDIILGGQDLKDSYCIARYGLKTFG